MVFYILQFKASRTNIRNIDDILKSVILHTRFKIGCNSTNIWHNRSDNSSLLLYEIWDSLDNLVDHLKSNIFRKVLVAMELCSEKPDMKVIDSEKVMGLDWLEKILLENQHTSSVEFNINR